MSRSDAAAASCDGGVSGGALAPSALSHSPSGPLAAAVCPGRTDQQAPDQSKPLLLVLCSVALVQWRHTRPMWTGRNRGSL